MTLLAYIAISLDGYIADNDGKVDWLNEIPNPEQSDYGFADFIESIDAIVMGANTFRVVQSFGVWPYQKPVFVVSNSIQTIPDGYENRISLVRGNLSQILKELQQSGYNRLYVDGGSLIKNCLTSRILDELILTHIPILLGDGIPLFPTSSHPIQLEHQKTDVVGIGLVKSHYRINHASKLT